MHVVIGLLTPAGHCRLITEAYNCEILLSVLRDQISDQTEITAPGSLHTMQQAARRAKPPCPQEERKAAQWMRDGPQNSRCGGKPAPNPSPLQETVSCFHR